MEVQDWLETIKTKPYHSESQSPQTPYGFVVGWKDGKGYVLGPYNDEDSVNRHSMEFDPNSFVAIWSRYRQQNVVTRGVKHDKLDSGSDLTDASKRMKHQETNGL